MERPPSLCLAALFGLLALGAAPAGEPAPAAKKGLPNPFFAYCHDTHDAKHRSLKEQADLLKELGFDGVGHLWLDNVAERLATLDAVGLKLVQVYVRVSLDPKQPKYDPRLKDVLPLLKDRGVILGALVTGGKPSDPAGDPRAVEILREMADLAQPAGVRIALYPHAGDWLERVEDAVRVAKLADRPNLGVMFNLCHWLKTDDEKNLESVLKLARPHLFVVSLNGADLSAGRAAGWDRLIQPLDSGTFDLARFLRLLRSLDYTGPLGLMCYGLGGDARDHLQRSVAAWRKLSAGLAP